MKNQKGFSLLEFLMSLFIVFVLTIIGCTQYINVKENARQSALKANMHTIQICAEDFSTRADGVYPGGINTMVCTVSTNYRDSSIIAGANKPPYDVKSLIPVSTYNPIDSIQDAIRNGAARKPAGCVYYCGLDASGKPTGEGNPAYGYKITAMGYYRPLTDIITYRIPREWGKGDK
jgi:type II secretory pathway pseudopilin PulG